MESTNLSLNFNIEIINSTFHSNTFSENSGVFFFEYKSYIKPKLLNSTFIENKGSFCGVMLAQSLSPIISRIIFLKNEAFKTLHNNILSIPIKINLLFNNEVLINNT